MTNSRVLLIMAGTIAFSSAAQAFINPNFTPVDLVKQSEIILHLEFETVDDEGVASARVLETLKGEHPREFRMDLYAGAIERLGDMVKEYITAGARDAMFFAGAFDVEGGGGAGPGEGGLSPIGFLHLEVNKWYVLELHEEDVWDFEKEDAILLGTWAGGTDMLRRCVKYVLSDPDADVPVTAGRSWEGEVAIADIPGKIFSMRPVDLDGDGKTVLFIASASGDRLFGWNGSEMKNLTAALELGSASFAHAWADFTRNGKTDLASWCGEKLTIWEQSETGVFGAHGSFDGGALSGKGGVALAVTDSGSEAAPALIAAAGGSAAKLVLQADGTFEETALANGTNSLPDGVSVRNVLIADFNGNSHPDIVRIFEDFSLFHEGVGPGAFKAPVKIAPGTGPGENDSRTGDFDADGMLDIVTVAADRVRIWHNYGNNAFAETLWHAGEISYISKGGASAVDAGDVNNNGRTDLLISYQSALPPQVFFNRGFRSFGHSRELQVESEEIDAGQQAGCLGDFNHDGALDMCLALEDGSVRLFFRKMEALPDLAVTVGLSTASPFIGPVTVGLEQFGRYSGAQIVTAGGANAHFGMREPGPVTLRWRFPGEQEIVREYIVEDGPLHVVIDRE